MAVAALNFAIDFLGCRMGPQKDQPLDANARSRLQDICRAVSIVESRHGTVGTSQPARDPLQGGNPGDSWWKELTGQSGNGSRFVRGPTLSNLWAYEVAAEAEGFTGFSPAAALAKLGQISKGHDNAQFTPSHSYYWGIIYLIHRINTEAGDPSFSCGDLNRSRLIDGAATYNGKGNGSGVPDYKDRLLKALAEFGGLATLGDEERRDLGAASGTEAARHLSSIIAAVNDTRSRQMVRRVALRFAPDTGRIVESIVEFGGVETEGD